MFRVGVDAERQVLTQLQYRFPELVHSDLIQVRSVFSDLRLYSDYYRFPNNQRRRLLFLAGTIPVFYQGSHYNVPVCLWLHQLHPEARPRCCVVPSVSMEINPHCQHVDANGNILLPCLHTWNRGDSSLLQLAAEMKQAFEEDTPLYSKPLPVHQTTPPDDHATPPAPGGSPSWSGLGPGSAPGSGSPKAVVQKRSYCEDLKGIDFSSSSNNSPSHSNLAQSNQPNLKPMPVHLTPFTNPAHSDTLTADALIALAALKLNSSQSAERSINMGQSDRRRGNTSLLDERSDNNGQADERSGNTGQSVEPRGNIGILEKRQNCKLWLGPDSEDQQLKLPPHKLQMFLQLLQSSSPQTDEGRGYSTGELLEAVRLNEDLPSAQRYLRHLCPVCQEHKSFSKMVLMTHCSCLLCEACFKSWFSAAIREKHVEQFVCPLCGKPDFRDRPDLDQDYFNLLDTQIRHFLSEDLHELFQRKLRDRALTQMKHFCWCSHCSFGVVHESGSLRMDCPSCNKSTCSQCRAPWSPEHHGVSCEDFRVRTKASSGALFNYIECPDCGEVYSGSRGGCLHFSCPRCGTDFCGGCSQRFIHGQACGFSETCSSRGFHAHHPRDCVYHLRDWGVARLHLLLQFYRVSPVWIEPANQTPSSDVCPVTELRDSAEAPCGKTAVPGLYRGYCRSHYVERLVQLLNSFSADPVVLFSLEELETELRRWNQTIPSKNPSELDQQYHIRLTQVVLQTVPLKKYLNLGPALWTTVSAPPRPLPGTRSK